MGWIYIVGGVAFGALLLTILFLTVSGPGGRAPVWKRALRVGGGVAVFLGAFVGGLLCCGRIE
jgi:hypothetical protein